MWKTISDWNARRKYRARQNQVQSCGIYIVDDFGLALPTKWSAVTFPEEPVLTTLSMSMLDPEAIGRSVVSALDYAGSVKQPPSVIDYEAVQARFMDQMELYRKRIGIGRSRFESHMQLINVTREDGELLFLRCNRQHGRFAFASTALPEGRLVIPQSATLDQIGQSVLKVHRNQE